MKTAQTKDDALTGFPQKSFASVCFGSLGLIERNREYLAGHLGTDENAAQALEDIRAASARLDRALGEMFALLDCMRGRAEPVRRAFDLRDLLKNIETQRQAIRHALGVELRITTPESLCAACADEEWAEQICLHLLSNALHACGDGGQVVMELKREGENAELSVTDDGCGLPDASPDSRLENRRRFLGGAQAGLMLCREYCEKMGWSLKLESLPGGGTKAALAVPLGALGAEAELRSDDGRVRRLGDYARRFIENEVLMLGG